MLGIVVVFIFGDVIGVLLWYFYFEIKIERFED